MDLGQLKAATMCRIESQKGFPKHPVRAARSSQNRRRRVPRAARASILSCVEILRELEALRRCADPSSPGARRRFVRQRRARSGPGVEESNERRSAQSSGQPRPSIRRKAAQARCARQLASALGFPRIRAPTGNQPSAIFLRVTIGSHAGFGAITLFSPATRRTPLLRVRALGRYRLGARRR